MIERVLVANRGEIAVRIVRACHKLGRNAVVAHSDPDASSLAVSLADDAVALGGVAAAETYLDIEKLIDAARRAGCDAVHPGYGFLSERAEFAAAVDGAGLTYIGPTADVIATMGDKVAARQAAVAAGVPVVPGTTLEVTDADAIRRIGDEIGWPLAVKAAFGGGGRGMRVITGPADAADALDAARREATAAFGRAEVYAERFLPAPRHIEVQVMADHHGHAVAVGDRDCSVQRRYQKLIEEAPAPGLSDAVRAGLAESAVALVHSIGYTNAGTIEYLVQDDEFFFLEMNTRIQVEHPVTELTAGVDLVTEQILVAEGAELSFGADDVRARGAAIEIRINAEDPAGGAFVPSPGELHQWQSPTGPDVRVDSGFRAGDAISPFYDNLIAKVIAWGRDRDGARRRAIDALTELQVAGVPTTAPAALAVLTHDDFIAVRHSTHWLEAHAAELLATSSAPDIPRNPTVVAASGVDAEAHPSARPSDVDVAGRRYRIPRFADHATSADAGTAFVDVGSAGPPPSTGPKRASRRAGSGRLVAPMQGTVVRVHASVGDAVAHGDALVVLEAMKMENTLTSDVDGVVSEVAIEAGTAVGPGDVLVVVRPNPAGGEECHG